MYPVGPPAHTVRIAQLLAQMNCFDRLSRPNHVTHLQKQSNLLITRLPASAKPLFDPGHMNRSRFWPQHNVGLFVWPNGPENPITGS